MSEATILAIILGAIAVIGAWRVFRRASRWRVPLMGAQFVLAGALYGLLFASIDESSPRALVVLTARVEAARLSTLAATDVVVALPEYSGPLVRSQSDGGETLRIARFPDLATALRTVAHRGAVRVLGAGLVARDHDVARALTLRFEPSPPLPGIVDWQAPRSILAGRMWDVLGQVEHADATSIELRDPADRVVAQAALDDTARFRLRAVGMVPGKATYHLRLLDAHDNELDRAIVPVVIEQGQPIKALVLAGGPQPELKYLRRWALDAGIDLRASIALSDRATLRQGESQLDAEALRALDLLIVDERAWSRLRAGEKTAVVDAVDRGLGLLLRVSGPLTPQTAREWQALGVRVTVADLPQVVGLMLSPNESSGEPSFTRRAVNVEMTDGRAEVVTSDRRAVMSWRSQRLGRVGAWTLDDSYRLVLEGRPERFGTLWSETFQTLARARGEASPTFRGQARIDERLVICDMPADARWIEPESDAPSKLVDDDEAEHGCAAIWPRVAGWHVLRAGERSWPVHVRSSSPTDPRIAHRDAVFTREIAASAEGGEQLRATTSPDTRWPWFALWLALAALTWWLERRAQAPAAI